MNSMLALMTTQRAIGYVVIAVVFIGGFFFVWTQMRKGRKEAGSEIELAPNRKQYFDDEKLETTKLNWALWASFGFLIVVGVTLPLYWLAEGGRQEGMVAHMQDIFQTRGEETYVTGAQCVGCHGPEGVGGSTNYVITDENGEFLQQVTWNAPALNTVLWRFSQAEVRDVLVYGRPGTPMAAWGVVGGGALSDQQLDNVIDYLWTVQLTREEMDQQVMDAVGGRSKPLADRLAAVKKENGTLKDPLAYECPSDEFACLSEADNLLLGEILFNMGESGGAYACARCHVPGAAFGQPWQPVQETGRSRFAPSLIGIENDLTIKQHFALVMSGTEYGKLYGNRQQGSGRMPGFGINPNNGDTKVPQLGAGGMLSPEEVWAIVVYERSLSVERPDLRANEAPAGAPTTTAPRSSTGTSTSSGSNTTTTTAPSAND